MTPVERAESDAEQVITLVRLLLERSSLGEEGPRLLRGRAPDDQLERIRRLRHNHTNLALGPSESAARRLIAEVAGDLPKRTPDHNGAVVVASRLLPAAHEVEITDPRYNGCLRNDSDTLTRVVDELRRLA
ncbi:hypothetical protein [Nocardia noduli]|uniref:hypothetical protein n=1 Tax=Nocardia noduli TaxID=2815722 RepID=UPI001C223468|nr:hypothetical protein [Nocardia noduli]